MLDAEMQKIREEELNGASEHVERLQDQKNRPKGPRLLEVRRETFGQILLTLEVVQDHLPDAYLTAINQL